MSAGLGPGEGDDPTIPIGPLVDLWSWGFETSRAMSERVLEMYAGLGTSAMRALSGDLESELRSVRLDVERLADLSVEVFDRLLAVVSRVGKESSDAPLPPDQVVLRVRPGESTSAELWVHNVSTGERAVPRVRCTELVAATGGEPLTATIELAAAPLAAGNSRLCMLALDVAHETQCGVYHGVVTSDATPDSVVLVSVEVSDSASTDGSALHDAR